MCLEIADGSTTPGEREALLSGEVTRVARVLLDRVTFRVRNSGGAISAALRLSGEGGRILLRAAVTLRRATCILTVFCTADLITVQVYEPQHQRTSSIRMGAHARAQLTASAKSAPPPPPPIYV